VNYAIEIKRNAQKSLLKITEPYQSKLIDAIYKLGKVPYGQGCKKLSGRDAWRMRVGDYRVIYEVNDEDIIILVIKIAHRKEAYR